MSSSLQALSTSLSGAVFLYASCAKGYRLRQFTEYLSSSWPTSSASPRRTRLYAKALVGVEAVIALPLLLQFRPALAGAWAFLVLASSFLALQYMFSSTPDSCGCFGGSDRQKVSSIRRWEPIPLSYRRILRPAAQGMRNTAIAILLGFGAWGTALGSSVVQLLAVAAPALLFAVALGASVLSEFRKLRLPKHPRYDHFAPHLGSLTVLEYYR